MQAAGACIKILGENAVTGEGLPTHGTQVLMNVINETGALPTHNGADVQFDGASKIGAEAIKTKVFATEVNCIEKTKVM